MSLPTPYYSADGITLFNADCREILPELTADVLVTDPPYGLDFPYLSYHDTRDALRSLIATAFPLFAAAAPRSLVLCGPTQIGLYPQPDWVSCVTWNTTGSFGKCGYNQWTPVLVYGADVEGFGSVRGTLKSDTLRINGGASVGFRRSANEKEHSCPKPLGMMRLVIQRFTAPDSSVCDPFAGSGSTLVAAKQLGRRGIGIEIEERYCDIIVERLRQRELLPPAQRDCRRRRESLLPGAPDEPEPRDARG